MSENTNRDHNDMSADEFARLEAEADFLVESCSNVSMEDARRKAFNRDYDGISDEARVVLEQLDSIIDDLNEQFGLDPITEDTATWGPVFDEDLGQYTLGSQLHVDDEDDE